MASSAKRTCKRIAVRLRIDGNRSNAQLLASAQDTQRDFAAIGDQNFSKHFGVRARKTAIVSRQRLLGAKPTWPALLLAVGADAEKRLAVFNRAGPFSTKICHDFARHVRFDFVHQLHRFDDAKHLPASTRAPTVTKGSASGLGDE